MFKIYEIPAYVYIYEWHKKITLIIWNVPIKSQIEALLLNHREFRQREGSVLLEVDSIGRPTAGGEGEWLVSDLSLWQPGAAQWRSANITLFTLGPTCAKTVNTVLADWLWTVMFPP